MEILEDGTRISETVEELFLMSKQFDSEKLEKTVRPFVLALQAAGIYTTGSCHHEGYILIASSCFSKEVEEVPKVLKEMGVEECEMRFRFGGGCFPAHIFTVTSRSFLDDEEGELCELQIAISKNEEKCVEKVTVPRKIYGSDKMWKVLEEMGYPREKIAFVYCPYYNRVC